MGFKEAVKSLVAKTFGFQTKAFGYNSTISLTSLLKNDAVLDINTYYDLYRLNGDIRQAVRKIANGVARNGIYLENLDRQTIEDNRLTDEIYSLFQSPTFLKFKVELYRNYMLGGELYILPVYNIAGGLIGFEIVDDRLVSKTVEPNGVIKSFTVSNHSITRIYKPDEIAYFKWEDDTYDSANGMGILNGCVYDALSDLEAMRTNYYFYQNSAIPSAMLLLDDGMSEEEYQNAKDQFEAQFRGTKNQHKTIIAGGVKDIKTLSITPRDMEFINQRHMTTEKISAVFGVPKGILGYVENLNYNNGANQRKEFIEGTLKPLESDFEHILNKLLEMFLPNVHEKLWIRCDGEQLEETQERMEGLRRDVASGILTINEARIERGYEAIDDENADKALVSRNMVLLEDIALDPILSLNEE